MRISCEKMVLFGAVMVVVKFCRQWKKFERVRESRCRPKEQRQSKEQVETPYVSCRLVILDYDSSLNASIRGPPAGEIDGHIASAGANTGEGRRIVRREKGIHVSRRAGILVSIDSDVQEIRVSDESSANLCSESEIKERCEQKKADRRCAYSRDVHGIILDVAFCSVALVQHEDCKRDPQQRARQSHPRLRASMALKYSTFLVALCVCFCFCSGCKLDIGFAVCVVAKKKTKQTMKAGGRIEWQQHKQTAEQHSSAQVNTAQ